MKRPSRHSMLKTLMIPGWIKKGVPIWYEERDSKTKEVNEYRGGFVQEINPTLKQIKILLSSENTEKTVDMFLIHQRILDHKKVKDLAEIPILNDGELMAHLELLYSKDEISVYCGPSLVVVNPYKKIPKAVSPELMNLIQDCLKREKLKKAPPHVWSIAAIALSRLKKSPKNQAICINGESGAGKTVSTKMCLEFLTNLEKKHLEEDGEDLSDQIMACNPVLEAFGNAKTMRNDNSSRFGKYVKLFYDIKGERKILGATMQNYLLEKSRVVEPAKKERSFHIFYAMCRFMPFEKQKKYFLLNDGDKCRLSYFNNLKKSGIYSSSKIDDKEFYDDVVNAFVRLEFSAEEEDAIWRILAAILYLGNIKVDQSKYEDGKTPCKIENNEDYKKVIKLLNCDSDVLEDGLTIRVRKVGSTVIKSPHKPEVIPDFISSMAKDLYNKMFNWIFKKMNKTLMGDLNPEIVENISSKPEYINTIGLLDIFGFEIFEKNYLEQLFINYANERLQGLYIDHIFKNECKFFIAQGLEKYVELIEYEDNLQLIEVLDKPLKPIGIFALTNQNSKLNKTDGRLMQDIKKNQKISEKSGLIKYHRMHKELFFIKHTARDVEYTITGFIDKNKDDVSDDIIKAINTSDKNVVNIYNEIIDDESTVEEGEVTKNSKFLAFKFTKNMNELMFELNSSNCHFIRCVKPNEIKRSEHWVGYLVLKQISYMGLLNSLKIRKKNYVFRFSYKKFYLIYKDLDMNKEGSMTAKQLEANQVNYKELTNKLLECLDKKPFERDLLIGKTKVLINDHYKIYLDEILKEKQKEKRTALNIITEHFKENMKRKKIRYFFNKMGNSLIIAKTVLTGIKARVSYINFKKRMQLVRKLQYNFRITKYHRNEALKKYRMKLVVKFCFFHNLAEKIKEAKKISNFFEFVKIRLRYLLYKSRKRTMRKLVMGIINKSWNIIKFKTIDFAAHDLQRSFRSYLLRKNNLESIKNLKTKMKNFKINNAVILVQSHTRRFLVQTRMERVQQAAKTIQRYYKSRLLRAYFLKIRKSAIIIQRAFKYLFKKQKIMKQKFKEVITTTGNGLNDVMKLEYKNIFGMETFFKGNDFVDYPYNRYLKNGNFFNKKCNKFIPNQPVVELKNKAKLFSLIIDFSVMTDTSLIYSKTWGYHFSNLMKLFKKTDERLLHIKVGETCTFAVSDDLKVYSWGSNDYSQLCRKSDKLFGSGVKEVVNLSKNKGNRITLGKNNGKMLGQNGEVFTWGRNSEGQLGLKNVKKIKNLYVKNDFADEIEMIDSDNNITYILTKKGEVLKYPYRSNTGAFLTKKIDTLRIRKKITEISTGSEFVVLKTFSGLLYSLGENKYGELGLGDFKKREKPEMITFFKNSDEKIHEFSCGYKHVIARTNANRIYVWGDNQFSQLGILFKEVVCKPILLKLEKKRSFSDRIKSVCAGAFSSYFLMENNYLFFFGRTGKGTLSSPTKLPFENIFFEEKMSSNFVPIKICSSWSTIKNIVYIVFLDFRGSTFKKKQLQEKVVKILKKDWKKDDFLPPFNEQLTKYIQRKNFKQHENFGIIDVTRKTKKKNKSKSKSLLKSEKFKEPEINNIQLFEDSKKITVNKLQINENNKVVKMENDEISKRLYKMMEIKNNEKKNKGFRNKKEALMSLLRDSLNEGEKEDLRDPEKKLIVKNHKLKLSDNNVRFIKPENKYKYKKSDKLKKMEKLEKLNRLDKLERLQRMEQKEHLEKMNRLEKMKKLERLNKLEKIKKLERLEREKEKLKRLDKIQQLENYEKARRSELERIEEIEREDSLERQELKIENERQQMEKQRIKIEKDNEISFRHNNPNRTTKSRGKSRESKKYTKAETSINSKNKKKVNFYNKKDFIYNDQKKSKSKSKSINKSKKKKKIKYNNKIKSSKIILKGLNSKKNQNQNDGFLTDERDSEFYGDKSMRSMESQIKKSRVIQDSNIFEKVEMIMKKDPKKWTNIDREIMNSYIKFTKGLIPN